MSWLYILLIISLIIGPFDALYLYIRSEKRRDQRKKDKKGGN